MTRTDLIEKMRKLGEEELTAEEMDNYEVPMFPDDQEPVDEVTADLVYGLIQEEFDTLSAILSSESNDRVIRRGDLRMTADFAIILFKLCHDECKGVI